MVNELPSGYEPSPRNTPQDEPQSLDFLLQHAINVEEEYGVEPEFEEKIIFFTKQSRTIRLAYETGLLSADEHDRLHGVFMAEKDRGQEIDELTDIYRKLAFLRRLGEQVALAKRNDTPLTVAFLDLDKFSEINSKYSHIHGDAVINQVAKYLKTNFRRSSDILGRYGGEEIGIIMPNTDESSAFQLLETINQQMSPIIKEAVAGMELTPSLSRKRNITASIGVAQVHFSGDMNEEPQKKGMEALRLADDRMNLAKKHGRNVVVDSKKEQIIKKTPIRSRFRTFR
jgi:diguanylate cyclase (GGDEF)-like protein